MILRTRILGLAALLATLFLSLIGYTLIVFSATSHELNRIVRINLSVARTAESLNSTILFIRSDIWDTMVFGLDRRNGRVDRLDAQAKAFYQGLRDLAEADPTLAPTAANLRLGFQAYYQFGSTILELASLEDFVNESKLVQKFRENQASLLKQLSQTVEGSKDRFFVSMNQLNQEFSRTTVIAFTLAGMVTLLSFFIAILVARRLARPLEQLSATVHQVAGGDYTVRPTMTSSGEIRELTETFGSMLDQIEDYSSRMEDLVRARTDALVRTNAVMVKELKLARKIQDALVPHDFASSGPLRIAGAYLPMEELGGDFYDVFETQPGKWTVVMTDVSGHGVPAALVTAMVKISLGLHGRETSRPGLVVEDVNRELCAALGDLKRYATMVLCHLDLDAQTLAFCNAGHNELLVVRKSGAREVYGPNSGVVGFRSDELFLTRTIPFAAGDSLILFTDGLIEARNGHRVEFGLDRLFAVVDALAPRGPDAIVDRLKGDVLEFCGTHAREDDIAVLALRRETSTLESTTTLAPAQDAPVTVQAEDLYRHKEYAALLEWSDRWIEASPQEASQLYHWKAMALHHLGDDDAALKAWDQALQANPENRRARRNRAYLERFRKEANR